MTVKQRKPKVCPYFKKAINKPKTFKAICCSAISYNIGFSDKFGVIWLTPRTFNKFFINTHTGANIEFARDSYIKNNCKGTYSNCEYYKKKAGEVTIIPPEK
jgi:hypothetical protein